MELLNSENILLYSVNEYQPHNPSNLKTGLTYTVMANQKIGELILGLDIPSPFLTKILNLFQPTNSRTHPVLEDLSKNRLSGLPIDYFFGTIKVEPEAVIVSGFNSKRDRLTSMIVIGNTVKSIVPSALIYATPGKLSDLDEKNIKYRLESGNNLFGWDNGPVIIHQ